MGLQVSNEQSVNGYTTSNGVTGNMVSQVVMYIGASSGGTLVSCGSHLVLDNSTNTPNTPHVPTVLEQFSTTAPSSTRQEKWWTTGLRVGMVSTVTDNLALPHPGSPASVVALGVSVLSLQPIYEFLDVETGVNGTQLGDLVAL